MYDRILIAIDGSDLADRALDQGIAIAKALGSEITVVTVGEPDWFIAGGYYGGAGPSTVNPELVEAQKKEAGDLLETAQAKVKAADIAVKTVYADNSFPAEGIVATAQNVRADLIVMGSHGRRGLGRLVLGSQTQDVLAQTKTPVLVTR